MIRNAVSEELKWTDQQINGIVLTGYVHPSPSWYFAQLHKDGSIVTSFITRTLEIRNTIYIKSHPYPPKFIHFPDNMNLAEFRKCNIHKLHISDFIKKHTGEEITV